MIQLATFNLRCPNTGDGPNYWHYRAPRTLAKIREESPDVIGFQEVRDETITQIKHAMPEYTFIGYGRDATFFGESTRIAFKTDLFQLHGMDQFWLSDTPRIPATRFENQSSCNRICNWVKLMHLPTQKRFIFMNTHLDHIGDEAKMKGLQLVLDVAKKLQEEENLPIFIVGDFNFTPEDAPYPLIAENELNDLTEGMAPTYHGFGKDRTEKIDYILTDLPKEQFTMGRWHENNNGVFLSDHDGITALWKD
ncbi:MAG: endonuclease/exonuclease/phosphatase family protein [Clostridiales bacterium]|nr:endonuclease/exonuclease/phosphatase family protein [Clostridiales bacterium]